jgi:predicted DNA-binding transcriptional regulator AlpA
MNTESPAGPVAERTTRAVTVTVSPWVNEPLPDIHAILCSRDLARLTRLPRWLLCGLAMMGKFPRRKRYRGRLVGWCRAEVLEWMTRDLAVAPETQERLNAPRHCRRQHARQQCLPLECRAPCIATRNAKDAHFERSRT